jgi:Putative beta barrel porin-7 (BBP7)
MTRARCFALAMLIEACSWGAVPVFAQPGMPGGPGGYPSSPYRTPIPMDQPAEWYGDPDEVVAGSAPYGPARIFDGAFIRTEYLHWNLKDPDDALFGAPLASVDNPSQRFDVFEPGTSNIIARARVPTTDGINLSDINGIRATVGMELLYGGTIEVGAFMLGVKQSGYSVDRFPRVLVRNPNDFFSLHFVEDVIATSLLNNGQKGDTVLLYNKAYSAVYVSQLWGGEGNYVGDYDRDGLFHLNPTIGLRYLSLHERLNQQGTYENDSISLPPVTTNINSMTFNNLYGPQFGFRLEMITKYLNFGIDPKLLLLGNTMFATVSTNHLRSNADPVTYTDELKTSFSFGMDLPAYAQINFGDRFSARVGYNFIWLNRVTRPEDNINYNDKGASNPPAISTVLNYNSFIVHGVSVGGEFRF